MSNWLGGSYTPEIKLTVSNIREVQVLNMNKITISKIFFCLRIFLIKNTIPSRTTKFAFFHTHLKKLEQSLLKKNKLTYQREYLKIDNELKLV